MNDTMTLSERADALEEQMSRELDCIVIKSRLYSMAEGDMAPAPNAAQLMAQHPGGPPIERAPRRSGHQGPAIAVAAQPGDQRRRFLGGEDAVDQLLAIDGGRLGQLRRPAHLRRRRRGEQEDEQQ